MTHSPRSQSTIARSVSVSGFGYWSGEDVTVKFNPAKPNSGIVFVRTDMESRARIPALIHNRVQGPRRTTLVLGDGKVEMVEHILSALYGLSIDNCEVEVTRAEMPGMDGSSAAFTESLLSAGRVEQAEKRKQVIITEPIRIEEKDAWISAGPTDDGSFQLTFDVDYSNCPAIGHQQFSYSVDPRSYPTQVAPARTFVLKQEADLLRQQGLGQRVTFQDLLVFDDAGPIDNELLFDDECARHKLLDMIGDLALTGVDLVGQVHGFKSGHRLNAQLAFAVLQQSYSSVTVNNRVSA